MSWWWNQLKSNESTTTSLDFFVCCLFGCVLFSPLISWYQRFWSFFLSPSSLSCVIQYMNFSFLHSSLLLQLASMTQIWDTLRCRRYSSHIEIPRTSPWTNIKEKMKMKKNKARKSGILKGRKKGREKKYKKMKKRKENKTLWTERRRGNYRARWQRWENGAEGI